MYCKPTPGIRWAISSREGVQECCYTLACIALIVFAGRHLHTKKAAVSGGLLLQGFGVANDDAGESVAAYKEGTAIKPFLCGAANRI